MERFEEENSSLVGMQVFVGKISALMNPVTYVIINGGHHRAGVGGRPPGGHGIITQGAVVALVNYMSQIPGGADQAGQLIINISKALACAGRVQKVFEEKSSIVDPAGEGGGLPAGEPASGELPAGTDGDGAPAPPGSLCPEWSLRTWTSATAGPRSLP